MISNIFEFDITKYKYKFVNTIDAEKELAELHQGNYELESSITRDETYINIVIKKGKVYIIIRDYGVEEHE